MIVVNMIYLLLWAGVFLSGLKSPGSGSGEKSRIWPDEGRESPWLRVLGVIWREMRIVLCDIRNILRRLGDGLGNLAWAADSVVL